MPRKNPETAYIMGAGFSHYAGSPLQVDFTSDLLGGKGEGTGPSGIVVQYLRQVVNQAFDHRIDASAKYWPALEDILTCVDLSANTGHTLGAKLEPSVLRTVRRALIYRIITMLGEKYILAKQERRECWNTLEKFLLTIDIRSSAFISTNWDTVIEERLADLHGVRSFDYGCDARAASTLTPTNTVKMLSIAREQLPIVKIHGSINWLYCDNCREVYWFAPKETGKVAGQLLRKRDWEVIDPDGDHDPELLCCSRCRGDTLGTRLATFSYLKALDFPMFQKSWFLAEKLLRSAKRWIFIGYSMPAGDYEFKYLLKRIQLSRPVLPKFFVITGGTPEQTDRTYRNYQSFFGRSIRKNETFFSRGLEDSHIKGKI